jgi:flavoprotein
MTNRIFPVPHDPGDRCELCQKAINGKAWMIAQDRGVSVIYTFGHQECLKAFDRQAVIDEKKYTVNQREWFHGKKSWLEIKP